MIRFLALALFGVPLLAQEPQTLPTQSAMAVARGDVLFEQQRFADALVQYTVAMQRSPDDSRVRLRVLSLLNQNAFPLPIARIEHTGPVLIGAWSADGQLLATGGQDGMVNVLEVATKTARPSTIVHPGGLLALVFSSNGKVLASGGADGKARVCDTRTGQLIAELDLNEPVSNLAFAEGDQQLLVAGSTSVRIWPWPTKDASRKIEVGEAIRGVSLAARGNLLAVAIEGRVVVYNSVDGSRVREIPGSATLLAFSPDGVTLAAAANIKVQVWNAASGEQSASLTQDGEIKALAFSADGRRLATAGSDARARVWDVSTGILAGPPANHESAVVAVSLNANGSRMATANLRGIARIWDSTSGQPVTTCISQSGRLLVASLSPAGTQLLTGEENGVARVWDVRPSITHAAPLLLATGWSSLHAGASSELALVRDEEGRSLQIFNATNASETGTPIKLGAPVVRSVFSPDGTRALTLDASGSLQTWDTSSAQQLGTTFQLTQSRRVAPQFSPDFRLFAGMLDQTVGAINLSTGNGIGFRFELGALVSTFAFRPDSARLYVGGQTGKGRLWNPANAAAIADLDHGAAVHAAAFDATNRLLATASADKTARLWNASTGAPVAAPMTHDGAVNSIAFNIDGTLLATGDEGGEVRLWDTNTGKLVATSRKYGATIQRLRFGPAGRWLQVEHGPLADDIGLEVLATTTLTSLPRPPGPLSGFNFGPKAMRLLARYADDRAELLDAMTGQAVSPALRHNGAVSTAVFSADGRLVLTASWDGTARVWDAASGWPLTEPLRYSGPVTQAAFSVDETRILALVAERELVVTPLGPWTQVAPEWFPQLVEAITGTQIGPDGRQEITDARRVETINELKTRLSEAPATDSWAAWGQRFLRVR